MSLGRQEGGCHAVGEMEAAETAPDHYRVRMLHDNDTRKMGFGFGDRKGNRTHQVRVLHVHAIARQW